MTDYEIFETEYAAMQDLQTDENLFPYYDPETDTWLTAEEVFAANHDFYELTDGLSENLWGAWVE